MVCKIGMKINQIYTNAPPLYGKGFICSIYTKALIEPFFLLHQWFGIFLDRKGLCTITARSLGLIWDSWGITVYRIQLRFKEYYRMATMHLRVKN